MKKLLMVLVLLSLSLIFGCSKKDATEHDPVQSEDDNHEFVESKEPGDLDNSYANRFPLTGMGTNEAVDQRIVGVMINNHPAARPQSGLSQADIVFEILAEGNITRFLALFQSESPDVVGPVRSAREYYFDLAEGYGALYVFHGAANFVKDMIVNRGIEHLDGAIYDNDQKLFKRESFRKAPHNSYLLFDAVNTVAESKGYDIISHIEPLPFVESEQDIQGENANQITITYPGRAADDTVMYTYNEAEGNYQRFERQAPTVELSTEEPIELANILIIETSHQVIDDAGRRQVDIESGGPALLFQKGKVQQVEWMNQDGQIIPVKDGKPIGFTKGKTWINVVPSDPGIGQIVKVVNE